MQQFFAPGRTELGGNQCASLHRRFILAPGEVLREAFFLGEGPRAEGVRIRKKYAPPAARDAALAAGILAAWCGAGLFPVSVICCVLVFVIELFV